MLAYSGGSLCVTRVNTRGRRSRRTVGETVVEINPQAVRNNLPDLSLNYNLPWPLQLWYEMKGSYVSRPFSLQVICRTQKKTIHWKTVMSLSLSVRSLVGVCVRLCFNELTYSDKI